MVWRNRRRRRRFIGFRGDTSLCLEFRLVPNVVRTRNAFFVWKKIGKNIGKTWYSVDNTHRARIDFNQWSCSTVSKMFSFRLRGTAGGISSNRFLVRVSNSNRNRIVPTTLPSAVSGPFTRSIQKFSADTPLERKRKLISYPTRVAANRSSLLCWRQTTGLRVRSLLHRMIC